MNIARMANGYSLLELLLVMGLATTMGAVAAGEVLSGMDSLRTVGAVRYMAARLQRTRMDAVSRGVNTAMRVTPLGVSYTFSIYADGNGDGVRSQDILNGVDKRLYPSEQINQQFPGIAFATLPGLPAVDTSSLPPGSDPIKLGTSNMASFTPLGSSTAGSLYVLGPHRAQYVIRIFGDTGKIRILKFNERARTWDGL
jgi:type II secretory pathway pseudopilin PulG